MGFSVFPHEAGELGSVPRGDRTRQPSKGIVGLFVQNEEKRLVEATGARVPCTLEFSSASGTCLWVRPIKSAETTGVGPSDYEYVLF